MPLDPDLKDQLKSHGLWTRYVSEYEALRDAGIPMGQARKQAVEQVCQDGGVTLTVPGSPGAPAPGSGEVELPPAAAPASAEMAAMTPIAREVFLGKTCSVLASIQWVADNLIVAGVGPEDAPSPAAWGLLTWAGQSPVSRLEFYRMMSKLLPSRAELAQDEQPFRDDGEDLSKSPFSIWLKERYGPDSPEVEEYKEKPGDAEWRRKHESDPHNRRLMELLDENLAMLPVETDAECDSFEDSSGCASPP